MRVPIALPILLLVASSLATDSVRACADDSILRQTTGMPVRAPSPGILSALGAIFSEDHIAESALQIHRNAEAMPDKDRLAFLTSWVLPDESHSTLRLLAGFTTTYPVGELSLMAFQVELADGRRTRYHPVLAKDSGGMTRLTVNRQQATERSADDGAVVATGFEVSSVTALRINRDGNRVTVLARSSDWEGDRIVGTLEEPTQPVARGGIRLFLHSGDNTHASAVQLTKFSLHAEFIK